MAPSYYVAIEVRSVWRAGTWHVANSGRTHSTRTPRPNAKRRTRPWAEAAADAAADRHQAAGRRARARARIAQVRPALARRKARAAVQDAGDPGRDPAAVRGPARSGS